MEKETQFEQELSSLATQISGINIMLELVETCITERKIMDTIFYLKQIFLRLDTLHNFLLKYNDFFGILNQKFGTDSMKCNEASKKLIGDMKKEVNQVIIFVSQRKFKTAEEISKNLLTNSASLSKNFEAIFILPHKIDYSKLSNKNWRMIGVAGIHYRSKVFLSYYFRDDDPKKDENQQMIDHFVKPILELLNIEPVTARDYLKPQELIDDKVIELIEDCDGIVGFYTKGDSIENVEHELSRNDNVVAICKEEGAKAPSMRLSRLLINFKRDEMGDFLIKVTRILKDKDLFKTMV